MDKFIAGLFLHAAALAARLTLGQAFLVKGWTKLHGLDAATADFGRLGVPVPQAAALGAGLVELVGGGFLVLGLFTRSAAVALAGTVVCALVFIVPGAFFSALITPWPAQGSGLVGIPAWMALLPLLFLAGFGPGAISLSGFFAGFGKLGKGGGKKDGGDEGKKKDKKKDK